MASIEYSTMGNDKIKAVIRGLDSDTHKRLIRQAKCESIGKDYTYRTSVGYNKIISETRVNIEETEDGEGGVVLIWGRQSDVKRVLRKSGLLASGEEGVGDRR